MPRTGAAPTEVEIDSDRSTRNAKNTERKKEALEGGGRGRMSTGCLNDIYDGWRNNLLIILACT